MGIRIIGTGKYLPKTKMKNTDFDATLETSDEWIRSHTGIKARRIANKEETTSDLAAKACEQAIAEAEKQIDIQDIDIIICATATGDYKGFPSTACVVQKKLGAKNAFAFDITAACTGFVYALETAQSLLKVNNKKYALVIGAEVLSKVLDWGDKSTCVLFGDGAGAVLLENVEGEAGIQKSILGSDGEGEKYLYIDKKDHLKMNGRAVYNFAVDKITTMIGEIMQTENLSQGDLDYIVCHQANERIIQAAAKRLKFSNDKFIYNLAEYGNTSAATIPITLRDMQEKGLLKKGMKIILTGFGAGLTWGITYLVW